MNWPVIKPRQLFYDDQPDGYLESDIDYILNNIDDAVWLLDNFEKLVREAFNEGVAVAYTPDSFQDRSWKQVADDAWPSSLANIQQEFRS